jgi:DNA-directed RNA polymerase subunit H (RpoH/RPB5)
MDGFFKRLKYYGIGLLMGLIFVTFFMKNSGCSWMPENRLKTSLFERIIVLSEENQKKLLEMKVTEKELISAIREGDVIFKKSKKDNALKVYHIDCKTSKGIKFSCKIVMPFDSFISEIIFSNQESDKIKNTEIGFGKPIYFPKSLDFLHVKKSDLLTFQQKFMEIKDDNKLFKKIRESGFIDFEKSRLNRSPKPEHWITFKGNNNENISAKSIWYKEKIEIIAFDLPDSSSCK